MSFNAQDIVASLNKSGVAKTSHFEVQITAPPGTSTVDERDLMFRCDTTDLPGRTITSTEYRIYGPIRKIPYGALYGDINLSFLLSEDLREKYYFDDWQNSIISHGAFGSSNGKYNVEYYDDIVGTVTIRQFGAGGNLASVHTLQEAYPISIGPVSMSWGDDSVAKMTVTFAYRDYKVVYNEKGQPGLGLGFGVSINPGGAGGVLTSLRVPNVGQINSAIGGGFNVGQIQSVFGRIQSRTAASQVPPSF